ncbi:MAG: ParA family protein [Ardenticatenaceae bacterium]|nr:ParA family protein [Anaerolineales bacterium]MCB8923637.1 ParA family protein [Ardenticatenaceae bacterium]MCB8991856.1 ParA family protein [Ardenticatenaceae bacterium]MCB9005143.1 ParA family protein [Ardenticatenaceae bacterium]
MTQIIAIAMQKGGVGKTTTAVNLAAALTEQGQRVLAIDLDPQSNLTQHCGFDPDHISPTIYDTLKAEIEGHENHVANSIYQTEEGFHLLPSQPELSLTELALINTLSRERVLWTILEPVVNQYDYILIDCNPSLGLLVVNALTAATHVIIPIQAEYLAARGALMILSSIETVRRKKLNAHLDIAGILLTMADTRTILAQDIHDAIKEQYGDDIRIFDTVVKRSIRFAESAAAGQSILAYDGKSQGAAAYRQVASELLQ